jgi:hypothetical protein
MWRERALKGSLLLVGLFFTAGIYPLIGSLLHPAGSDTGDFSLVKLRPCGCDVYSGARNSRPAHWLPDWIGCTSA